MQEGRGNPAAGRQRHLSPRGDEHPISRFQCRCLIINRYLGRSRHLIEDAVGRRDTTLLARWDGNAHCPEIERGLCHGRQFGCGDHCSGDRGRRWRRLCGHRSGERHHTNQQDSGFPQHDRLPVNSCLTCHTRSRRAEERWLRVDISTAACLGCAHSDWDAQAAHLSSRHQMVAVDLRGHGASPGTAADCPIERSGADVAENHAGALFASRVPRRPASS